MCYKCFGLAKNLPGNFSELCAATLIYQVEIWAIKKPFMNQNKPVQVACSMCIYFVTVPENYAEARGVLLLFSHKNNNKETTNPQLPGKKKNKLKD